MPLHTTRGRVQASTSCTHPRLSISNGCPYPARPYLHPYATTAGSHPQSPGILRDPVSTGGRNKFLTSKLHFSANSV